MPSLTYFKDIFTNLYLLNEDLKFVNMQKIST